MRRLQIITVVALASKLAAGVGGGDPRDGNASSTPNAAATSPRPGTPLRLPRVLKSAEPADSRIVMLPGAGAPARAPLPTATPAAPQLVATGWRPRGVPALPPAPEVPMTPPPADRNAVQVLASVSNNLIAFPAPPRFKLGTALPGDQHKPAYPSALAQESAVYCQKEIGRWTLTEARTILGEPHRQRPAVDDDAVENGHIYAFRDPTNRYRELELDFDKNSGVLRSVFVYPWNLTWQDCRKLWGTNVAETAGNKGRVFYSYVNRHLDVLVDHDGKVISLGLY